MLEDFKENEFVKYAKNLKKIYHAYLFEVSNIEESYPLILAFAKMIICKNHYSNNSKCLDCNICHLIDNNSYPDLKIVEPEGSLIKKEQILNLQKSLSLKSTDNSNQVYIIKNAEKLNPSSSNSLLKFLEEPEQGIYGILITTNRKELLPTVLSRCIIISLKTNNFEYLKEDIMNVLNFLKIVNNYKEDSIAYLKKDFFTFFSTREEIIKAFNIMEIILESYIKIYYHKDNLINKYFYDIIKENNFNFNISDCLKYLDSIIKYKDKLLNVIYVNLNLLMDRFIMDIFEVV